MEAIAMPIALNGGGDGINGRRGEVVMRPMAAMAGYRPSMRAVTDHGHPIGWPHRGHWSHWWGWVSGRQACSGALFIYLFIRARLTAYALQIFFGKVLSVML
jgi:hypothetical protein